MHSIARSARRSSALLRRNLRSRALREFRIELAGLFPTEHVKRLHKLADAVHLGAEQAKFDDLLVAEMLGEILVHLVLVDGVLALLEQSGVAQRRLLLRREMLAAGVRE